jgi:hypothetical protein
VTAGRRIVPEPKDPTQRELLDAALEAFVDAAIEGDVEGARRAFADAAALPTLAAERLGCHVWVARCRVLAGQLADDLDAETSAVAALLEGAG